jgi:hypothetical protein
VTLDTTDKTTVMDARAEIIALSTKAEMVTKEAEISIENLRKQIMDIETSRDLDLQEIQKRIGRLNETLETVATKIDLKKK